MTDTNDASFARLVRLAGARGLSEVEQTTSDTAPALEVAGNSFIHLLGDTTAVLRCPADQKVLLMDISPEIFFQTDHYVGEDAVLVRLDKISDEELSLKLEDAWTFMAPERLKRQER